MSAIEGIRQQDVERIYLFQRRGRKLCLDVNAARVVRVSEAAWGASGRTPARQLKSGLPGK